MRVNIPIPPGNNLRLRTLRITLIENINSSLNILRCSIIRKEVLRQSGSVCTADSLTSEITSEFHFQIIADFGTDDSTLNRVSI